MAFVQQALNLLINTGGGSLAEITLLRELVTYKWLFFIGAKSHGAQVAHSPARYHAACKACSLNQVHLRTRSHIAHHYLLSRTPAKHHRQTRHQVCAAVVVSVFAG